MIISCSKEENIIKFWNTKSGAIINSIKCIYGINCFDFEGKELIIGCKDFTIRIYSVSGASFFFLFFYSFICL